MSILEVPLIRERERVVVERTTHPSFAVRIRVSGVPPGRIRTVVEMLNCMTDVGNYFCHHSVIQVTITLISTVTQ